MKKILFFNRKQMDKMLFEKVVYVTKLLATL